jgi:hypothetical protein
MRRVEFKTPVRLALAAFSMLMLAGCLSVDRSDAVPQTLVDSAEVAGYSRIRIWGDDASSIPPEQLLAIVKQRALAAKSDPGMDPRHVNALTLSGGGSSGAFGAGVLAGWSETGARPKFDIVTGISTGSLIAPFAFLGSSYDDELSEAFTSISDDDIYKMNSLLGAFRSGAVTSNAPLRRMLDKYITDQVIDEVAREYGKGRRLLVGTTNLDSERPVIWNMGAIAASGRPDRAKLFKDVIIASTSIPGMFPPVHLKVTAGGKVFDEMHVDGGTSTQVFLLPPGLTARSLDAKMPFKVESRRLFIIRNARTTPEYSAVKPRLAAIAEKSISSLIKADGVGDLYRLYAVAQRDRIDYNLIDIPRDFTVEAKSPFDKDYMRALYRAGYEMGRGGVPWKKVPPGFAG